MNVSVHAGAFVSGRKAPNHAVQTTASAPVISPASGAITGYALDSDG